MTTTTSPELGIEWLNEPTVDGYGAVTVGEWGGYLVQILPMIFNDRLVLTPERARGVYDYGWCFAKGGAAMLAAMVWNPATQAEPVGYIKAVIPGRVAGELAAGYVSPSLANTEGANT